MHQNASLRREKARSQKDLLRRRPGRPRSEHARQAILRSTLKLLQDGGFADFSMEAVAAAADVGKATIYRWWPTKAALIVDAFACSAAEELRFPDTGSVLSDMRLQMNQLVRVLRARRGRIVSAVIAGGQRDPDLLAAFRERFMKPRRQEAYETLRRGISRGELPGGTDLDLVLDCLYGPIYLRFLLRHQALSENFVDEVCGKVLGALRRPTPGSNGKRRL
jgi:AcrR family transcriptional regulator